MNLTPIPSILSPETWTQFIEALQILRTNFVFQDRKIASVVDVVNQLRVYFRIARNKYIKHTRYMVYILFSIGTRRLRGHRPMQHELPGRSRRFLPRHCPRLLLYGATQIPVAN